MAYRNTDLCMLNGGCVGCCGHDYPSAAKVQIAIDKNTLEFKEFKRKKKSLQEFRDRAPRESLRHGLCRNAIKHRGKLLCSIHPALAKTEKDLRRGHCDIRYLCKTAKAFNSWEVEKKNKFAKFTAKKRAAMTQAQYSLAMDSDRFLEEFCDS